MRFPLPLLLLGAPAAGFHGDVRPDDLLLTVTPGEWRTETVELESRSFRRVVTTFPGRSAEPGRPELPFRTLLVAVPDGYRIRVTVESEEHIDIPGPPVLPAGRDTIVGPENIPLLLPFVDDRFYRTGRWYPPEPVSTGELTRFRHQRVAPVLVRTFQTVPSTGLLRVYEKTVVRVRFERDRTKEIGARVTEAAGADPFWEDLYRNTIVNYEHAKQYRTRPARTGTGDGRSRKSAGAEYRIRVGESGLYRIDRDELTAAGMTDDPAAADITLSRRGFSESLFDEGGFPFTETLLPLLVEDADGDGLFESGDAIFAWLPGFREDRMERDYQDRFDTETAYFLGAGGGNPPLAERGAWRGWEGLTPLHSFPDSVRWEVDATYDIGPVQDTTDLYFAYSKLHGSAETEIDLPPPDRNGTFRTKGMTVSTLSSSTYHRYVLVHSASGDTVFNEVVSGARPALRKNVETFPSSLLAAGTNQFNYYGSRGNSPDNTSTTGAGGFLDWYEIHASFLYEAVDDYLRFSTGGEKGRVQIEAERFTGGEILLFDITEPCAPVRLTPDSVRSAGDTLFTVVLQDTVDADSVPVRSYVAATRESARRLGEGKITAAEAAPLASEEGDYVIIAWDDFLSAVEPLAVHRESEGMRVVRAPISAVYDRFQGGVKDPRAIRRYLRYAFERWETPPAYVLLVGDGYEDYKDAAANGEETEFDFLTAYPIWERHIQSGGDHWTASDAWYVLLDGDQDYLPEMLIGRFPAGSTDEARAMAEKTVLYETGRLDEAWRRRALFVADDAWTYSYGPIRNAHQTQFENGSKNLAARVTGQSTVRADTASFWLSTWTDIFHSACPYGDGGNPNEADLLCVLDLVRRPEQPEEGITAILFDRLNEGAFLVNFQGHGSRSSLTHELVLVEGMSYRGWYAHDITERTEPGRPPYIFVGYGCAISEFDRFKTFGDDAVGETMALFEEGGAVLTYGSTTIEYMGTNLSLNDYILNRFYPVPGETGRTARSGAGRTVGALLTAGMADYAAANHGWETARQYTILGDPALRVGPYAPDLALTVDGETVEEGAVRIPGADGAPMVMEAFFYTDLLVPEGGIVLSDGGAAVVGSLYMVARGDDDESGRWVWAVRYERDAGEEPGPVEFRFTDAGGSVYTRTVQTGMEIELSFDGDVYADSLAVPLVTTLRLLLPAHVPVDRTDIRAAGNGFDMEADTLYAIDDSTVAAELELALPAGMQTIRLSVGGLSWPITLNAVKSAIEIAVTVDSDPAPNGSSLLGHLDGTPPEIVALVGEPRDLRIEKIVLIDGEDTLGTDRYELVPDTIDGEFYRRLTYRPDLRNDDYEIRIEATESEGASAAFLLHVSLPITLTLDGADLIDGDFASPEVSARAVVVYADSLPPDEIRFLFDETPLPLDTLRREGANRWVAAAVVVEAEGGAHTVAFHAGAFGKTVSFRVEDRLRVVEPLVYPNPLDEGVAGFFYHLTLPADEVRVEIFTVTGRRIRVLTGLSGRAGYNANESVWNGRDQDGDRLARGVYPFRIIASRGGEKAEAIGKIVIR